MSERALDFISLPNQVFGQIKTSPYISGYYSEIEQSYRRYGSKSRSAHKNIVLAVSLDGVLRRLREDILFRIISENTKEYLNPVLTHDSLLKISDAILQDFQIRFYLMRQNLDVKIIFAAFKLIRTK